MHSDRPTLSFRNTDVTLLEWLGAHIALLLPVVNIVCLLRWSFSRQTKVSLQNYARSLLALAVVGAGAFFALSSAGLVEPARVAAWLEGARSAFAPPARSSEPFEGEGREYRTFTDASGRSMQAVALRFEGERVVVERVDGQVFETEISRFSEGDRRYLEELRRSLEAGQKIADSGAR